MEVLHVPPRRHTTLNQLIQRIVSTGQEKIKNHREQIRKTTDKQQ